VDSGTDADGRFYLIKAKVPEGYLSYEGLLNTATSYATCMNLYEGAMYQARLTEQQTYYATLHDGEGDVHSALEPRNFVFRPQPDMHHGKPVIRVQAMIKHWDMTRAHRFHRV